MTYAISSQATRDRFSRDTDVFRTVTSWTRNVLLTTKIGIVYCQIYVIENCYQTGIRLGLLRVKLVTIIFERPVFFIQRARKSCRSKTRTTRVRLFGFRSNVAYLSIRYRVYVQRVYARRCSNRENESKVTLLSHEKSGSAAENTPQNAVNFSYNFQTYGMAF